MGCVATLQSTLSSAREERLDKDPRWDIAGFDKWATECDVAWIRVGYLRELHASGRIIPYRNFTPKDALWVGAPPGDVQLYNVAPYTWLGEKGSKDDWQRAPSPSEEMHPDPAGFHLHKLVEVLDEDSALDDDLVAIFHVSSWAWTETPAKVGAYELYKRQSIRLNSFYRCKCIALCEVPKSFQGVGVLSRGWGVHEFHISAYCQRIVNSKVPVIAANLTPEKLLTVTEQPKEVPMHDEAERIMILQTRKDCFALMPDARDDDLAFQTVCQTARFRWVFKWYIEELGARGGPPPRCQDLPYGSFAAGMVPTGSQAYVVSYSWASSSHFSPTGDKIREVAAALARDGAKREDVVFIDFMSLPQAESQMPRCYVDKNPAARRNVAEELADKGAVQMKGRSDILERHFRFALYETTRLYAYRGCRVLVLPSIEPPGSFPSPGPVTEEENYMCKPPRREKKSSWGFSKSIPYESSGWPCAEFTVARLAGTIANLQDTEVQCIEACRRWPESIQDYAAMMQDEVQPVFFTKRGDAEAVRFNFFKYLYKIH